MQQATVTVGFDLDMTLIDSRPGIGAVYTALAAETGAYIDVPLVVSRLGPPLEVEIAHWFPASDVPAVAERYRELYIEHGIAGATPLPGAHESLAEVRAHGGRTLVVTAKYEPNARKQIDHLGLAVDALAGDLWHEAKGGALKAHGAAVYVGDHVADVAGARAAGAVAVAVATGEASQDVLRDAGADVVLADLTAFPAWFRAWLATP